MAHQGAVLTEDRKIYYVPSRAAKVLKINTTHLETNVCGKSPGNDACRRLYGGSQNRR